MGARFGAFIFIGMFGAIFVGILVGMLGLAFVRGAAGDGIAIEDEAAAGTNVGGISETG